MAHVVIWMSIQRIMLSEKSQSQMFPDAQLHLYNIIEMTKMTETWTD